MPLILLFVALLFTVWSLYRNRTSSFSETFLGYLLFFNLGIMGLIAAYAHIVEGPFTARMIGWPAGSPFQIEMGITNLTFGILGILAFWKRGSFWDACVIGWFILFVGCFIGHIVDYYLYNNTAPYNIGLPIWVADLIVPTLALILLIRVRIETRPLIP